VKPQLLGKNVLMYLRHLLCRPESDTQLSLYLQRGSDPHLIGGTAKSRGRAIAGVLMTADIVT
jgi:hypothetical protein